MQLHSPSKTTTVHSAARRSKYSKYRGRSITPSELKKPRHLTSVRKDRQQNLCQLPYTNLLHTKENHLTRLERHLSTMSTSGYGIRRKAAVVTGASP